MMDFAKLWSSRAEAEQLGITFKLSPEHTVAVHSSLHGGAVITYFSFLGFASVRSST